MYLCIYVCMYVCMYVCVYVCLSVCMYVCMNVCMYVCICVCGCIDYQWLFIGLLYEANYIFYPFAISHIHIQNSAHQGSLSLLLSLVAYVCCNDWFQAHGWDVLSDHWQKSAPNKPFLQVHGTKKRSWQQTGETILVSPFVSPTSLVRKCASSLSAPSQTVTGLIDETPIKQSIYYNCI